MRTSPLLSFTVAFLLSLLTLPSLAQSVPEPVTNTPLYEFIGELANDGIIDLNSAVKPYSRQSILALLEKAAEAEDELTVRQRKELAFFLADFRVDVKDGKMRLKFNPATAQYHDSAFSVTMSPVLGLTVGNDGSVAWKNGAKVYGNYGGWGFFAALEDNHQDPLKGKPEYLTRERGGHIKELTDFSEMKAGISYAWKWGDISFIKDSPVWGSGYGGTNILSGRAPSFIQVRLHVKPAKWLEMTWLHGWLNSMVVDSVRSFWVSNAYGTDYREVYRRKYFAANMFTVTPVDRLHISAGNSVVYADARLMPNYLMPFYFYKSVDHAVNSGIDNSNSQMFLDISSYNIKHLHLYGTLFIDELSTGRFSTADYNFFSWKGGFRAGNFSFLPNVWVTAEATFTYPLTFQHYVPVLTFENQEYNLGHYLRDNTRSFYYALNYKPLRAMNVRIWQERSERGDDFQSIGGARVGLPYINPVKWKNVSTGLEVNYMITGGVSVNASVMKSMVEGEEGWIAPHLYGSHTTFSGGIVWGF